MAKDQDDMHDRSTEADAAALRQADVVAAERATAPPEGLMGEHQIRALDLEAATKPSDVVGGVREGGITDQTASEEELAEGGTQG